MMSYDELELEKLGDEKTALFAVVSDTDPTFNFISAMMYSQMFNVLCDRALKVYHGRLPIHVTCLFDEFANQKIPNWEHLVSVIRSRNISAHIVLQTFSQLKGMYKDNAETVAGCCSTMLFLGGKEESSLKMVSGLLGKETIDTMNESDSRGAQRTYGLNYQKLGKELMSVDELAVMPSSRCIVQVQGVRPFYSKKYDLTKHPQYKYTADANPKFAFDVKAYLQHRLKVKPEEEFEVYDLGEIKELEADGRNATPEEQETLSRYVGWGGIPQAFDGSDEKWKTEYAELKGLLTPAEYEAARGSTLNAHYTAPVIIESIYHAVEQMGLEPKTMLEPAMGTGNFFGMVPDSMKDTALYGVELDSIRGMIALRDITRNLIETQLNGGSDAQIAQLQTRLNSAYDSFTAKWGLLNSTGNKRAFEQDSSYCLLCSLEVLDEDRNLERKADMFSKRTINQEKRIDHVDTPVEALAVSIGERAGVDLSFMAEILDRPGEELEIAKELSGVIFKNPEKGLDHPLGGWENADEYLSGNVRKKLAAARAAAEHDPAYAVNVSALEQSQPKDLSAAEIDVRIGATWIDPKYYTQFTYELLKTPGYLRGDTIAARYSAATGEWNISGKTRDSTNNTLAYVTYGTKRKNAYAIIEDSFLST